MVGAAASLPPIEHHYALAGLTAGLLVGAFGAMVQARPESVVAGAATPASSSVAAPAASLPGVLAGPAGTLPHAVAAGGQADSRS